MFTSFKKFISRQFIFPEVHIPFNDDIKGKVIIVTGASRGIGKATVEVLLKRGACVVAISRDKRDLENNFPEKLDSLLLCEADITLKKDIEYIFNETIKKFNTIDVLINNAAINSDKIFDEITAEELEVAINTNIKGAFLMSQQVIPSMKKKKSGLIINLGSKISHNTNIAPYKVLYATTKYALEGFSFSLNKELKPHGIRVVCLMPGTTNTFVSLNAKKFLSPYHIAELITTIIRFEDIDFEGVIFKSKYQNI